MNKISIEKIWEDEHMIELNIICANAFFGGEVNVYSSYEQISEFGSGLKGFPKTISDTFQYSLGTVFFRFYCLDSVGHIGIQVKMVRNPEQTNEYRKEEIYSAEFEIGT